MSTRINSGLRIAGAGTAAAALTLAAAAPAFAQPETDYSQVTGWLVNGSSLVLGPNPVAVALDAPEELAADGGITSVEVVAYPVDSSIIWFAPDIDDNAACGALPEDAGYGEGAIGCDFTDAAGLKEFPYSLRVSAILESVPEDEPYVDYVVEVFVNGATEPSSVTESDLDVSDNADGDNEEVPDEEQPPVDDGEGGDIYAYNYVDEILEGTESETLVPAHPQFQVVEEPADDRAATLITFTDALTIDSIIDGDWQTTDGAYAEAYYDNCYVDWWNTTCVVTDFAPEQGKTYGLSEDSPLNYWITELGVTEDDAALYWAEDLDEAELTAYIEETGVSLDESENSNLLSLVETTPADGSEFFEGYGVFLFLGDIDDIDELPGHGDNDGEGAGQLPSTGNSSIVLISSAAAALLAGAVVFFFLRRRKTAANWE